MRFAKCKANLYLLCFDIIKAEFLHLEQYNAKAQFLNPKYITFFCQCVRKSVAISDSLKDALKYSNTVKFYGGFGLKNAIFLYLK